MHDLDSLIDKVVKDWEDYYSKKYFDGYKYRPRAMSKHVKNNLTPTRRQDIIKILETNPRTQNKVLRALIKNEVSSFDKSLLIKPKKQQLTREHAIYLLQRFVGGYSYFQKTYLTFGGLLSLKEIENKSVELLMESEELQKAVAKGDFEEIETIVNMKLSDILKFVNESKTLPILPKYHKSSKYHHVVENDIYNLFQSYMKNSNKFGISCNNLTKIMQYNGESILRLTVTFPSLDGGYPKLYLFPTCIVIEEEGQKRDLIKIDEKNKNGLKNYLTDRFRKSNVNATVTDVREMIETLSYLYDGTILANKWEV